jgi:hypothetical protein
MLKSDGQGHSYKYCDWCGKYCGHGGVDSLFHNFCSEKCKRAYDNSTGTVDGGYKRGSIGHNLYKTGNAIGNFFKMVFYIVFGGAIILGIILQIIK